ncbi:MAG: rRNA (cytosine1402-N4)-methyltransferase [Chloroflexota bacterium]|jgi:16S rRNA (cytosine1402-N4)-methyltransferase|nr:rRNA (cytosine1402-N4)-methyltransferase [Chloroflexota bacterium]
MAELIHIPVLATETMTWLAAEPGGAFVDCTVNGGGHSVQLLERTAPDGRLLALDADPEAIATARARLAPFGTRAEVVHSNFRHLADIAGTAGFPPADGVLMDLGFSSRQIDATDRGFSFMHDAPLDMRYDTTRGITAAELLATASTEEIEQLLRRYGEEPQARRIAREVVASREHGPIATTGDLAGLVTRAVGGRHGKKLHPATQTFQALRIAVNEELEALTEALPQAIALLRVGGRVAVISFHSLEDRIVKTVMRRLAGREQVEQPRGLPVEPEAAPRVVRILTNRPVTPSPAEIAANPRSRSARLRVAERL